MCSQDPGEALVPAAAREAAPTAQLGGADGFATPPGPEGHGWGDGEPCRGEDQYLTVSVL